MAEAEILGENRGRSSEDERTRSEVESANIDCWPIMISNSSDQLSNQQRDLVSAEEFSAAFKALSKALSSNTK